MSEPTYTPNYNLAKPIKGTRNYDTFLNGNADIIDGALNNSFNQIGNLSNLTTTEKGSLVGATNEIKSTMETHMAETVTQVFNVKTGYGAKGDGVTNDAPAIQAAINDAAAAGGGIVYIPPGTYLVGSSLSWTADNITIQGSGRDITMIRDHPSLGGNRLIFLQGTSENRIANVKIDGITFRNGTASTSTYTTGKDGVRVEYVDGLTVTNCLFTEIQGAYGVVTKYTKNILVQNCEFYRWTYSGMTVLVECENIKILDNTFDTALAQNTPQNYTFATGGETLGEGEFFVKNLWIERNKFLNNPRWEGIDTHGGENVWIKNNYMENCRTGVMCGLTTGYVSLPVLKNVYIEDNIIIQGNGENDQSGIVVGGAVDSNNILHMAEHIVIRGNKVIGFGGEVITSIIGGITVHFASDVNIENNRIDDYAQSAVMIYHTVWGAKVINNEFGNCRGGNDPNVTAGITLRSVGLYDILIEGNRVVADVKMPKYFLRAASGNMGGIQIRNNSAQNVELGLYYGQAPLPIDKTTTPNQLTQKFGDVVYKNTGNPGWYVSAPKIGMGSQFTSTIVVTVNIEAGSNVATIVANSERDYRDLPPGMNVVIAGAGASGADLNARILKNDGKNLTLNVAADTTVSGANLTYQGLTLQAV